MSATVTPPFAPVRGLVGLAVGTDHKGVALRLGGRRPSGSSWPAACSRCSCAPSSPSRAMQVASRGDYNELFSMHGSTMIYLFVTPVALALGVYLVPLQVGRGGDRLAARWT